MSPFSVYLSELRNRFGLRQTKLAEMLGYEQSYISGLELGTKSPTNEEFLTRLIRAFKMTAQEQDELAKVVKQSQQRFVLPREVHPDAFRLCSELWDKIDRIPLPQLQAIRALLSLDVPMIDLQLPEKVGSKETEAQM
ncbi:helix-turn-helix domain-containing protein [Duganella sp. sic0402]|uniref:helix-turn-helix domain-containing protein n=1 Tax=Duganella sp. sic0402 TaxID=2854786 RepID=UPI001C488B21|nr:helix-turn-helix transcriptional regulator [Duganella sp. sic0402]MBV7539401.1 helix-turn-helix domain-containing protein [Duganella sp. sic0402]